MLKEENHNTESNEKNGVKTSTEISDAKNKKKKVLFGLWALLAVGLIVGLSIGLTRKNSDPSENDRRQINALVVDGMIKSRPEHLLNFSLSSFGPSSIETYDSCTVLENDLKSAAAISLEVAIARYARDGVIATIDGPTIATNFVPEGMESSSTNEKSGRNADTNTPVSNNPDDSYDTNNQVKGVDEADIVKSNGEYVFAAYGSEIVVWNAESGEVLSRTDHSVPASSKKSDVNGRQPYRSFQVESLLLYEDRITAVVSSIGGFVVSSSPEDALHQLNTNSLQVHTYNISKIPTDGGKLQHIFTTHMNGTFIEARSINNYAHVVTSEYTPGFYLTNALSRYNSDFIGLNTEEYLTKVKSIIEEKRIIENFVNRTMDIVTNENDCSHITKLSVFQTSDANASLPLDSVASGIMRSYGKITTIDMKSNGTTTDEGNSRRLNTASSVTGFFLPNSYHTKVYASKNHMVLATPGMSFSKDDTVWEQQTFFRIFELKNDGSNAQGQSVGKAPGYVLNQFSMDEWDGHLRVATTIRSTLRCRLPENQFIKKSTDERIRTPTADCIWENVSESDNMITILNITHSFDQTLDEVGSIKGLGHPGERIYSVRFMEEKAFMVTFRLTDPFYTFDLTNHSNPKMKGELKIPGFSNYLHPFDSEGNIMIAVGQNADETTGRTTGLQISLYNVTDLTNPRSIDRYDVQQGSGGYSSSDAQYDHKAFRFYEHSNKLIIPARMYLRNKSFDGFQVFTVSLDGISFHFDVEHNIESYSCWSNAHLSARSLIHSGILTTMKGHTIRAHDIESKEFQWLTNLDSNNTSC